MTAFNNLNENDRVQISMQAIEIVKKYEESLGRKVSNEQTNLNRIGCDLISIKDNDIRTIEVKGTCKPKNIPNAFDSEFGNGRLVADYLYVVYFESTDNYKLFIIPRKEITKDDIFLHSYYKFKTNFVNKINQYEVKVVQKNE